MGFDIIEINLVFHYFLYPSLMLYDDIIWVNQWLHVTADKNDNYIILSIGRNFRIGKRKMTATAVYGRAESQNL